MSVIHGMAQNLDAKLIAEKKANFTTVFSDPVMPE